MTLYGFVLFIHVVFAIMLVGGSAFAHVTVVLARRARTVDGLRSHVAWLHALGKSAGPLAMGVLAAGLYLAFAGDLWGSGWPVVSLVLFALAGATAMGVIDPRVTSYLDLLEDEADGPVTPQLRASLGDRTLTLAAWTLTGTDLAIVFLMTNKPGWGGSLAVAAVGVTLGAALGMREIQRAAAPPSVPAVPAG